MNKKSVFIFLVILSIAAFLRLYRLTDIPPGVNRDEASIGYTAYSLLRTGQDEYGRLLPLSFQSFGDWKLPFYIYSVIPLVSIFGLSELSVRLPSVIFGTASVALTFFLIKLLFKNNILAFITMVLISIAPWHLHLSRVESESNTAVFFVVLGAFLFLKSIKNRSWLIVPGMICFSLTYFIYAGNYIFTTLLVISIFLIYRKVIPKTKYLFIGAAIFFLLSGFIWYHTFFANQTKVSGINIFGDPSIVHAKIEIPRNEHNNPNSLFTRLVHNRIVFAMERFGQNYLNSFSAQFLFIKGGENRAHNIANFGNMYLIEAPFLFLGIIYLLVTKKTKDTMLALLWFFISPIAASITKDAPHTNRMFAIFPMLPLLTSLGFIKFKNLLDSWLKNKLLYKNIVLLVAFALFMVNILIYSDRYYVHFPRDEVKNWGLGYKKLAIILTQPSFLSKKVIMARPEQSPYIYLLFYTKYDPSLYQKTVVRYPPTSDGFMHVKRFDRFEFRQIDWGKDLYIPNALLVSQSLEVPDSIRKSYKTFDIKLPNNDSMFTVIETR